MKIMFQMYREMYEHVLKKIDMYLKKGFFNEKPIE